MAMMFSLAIFHKPERGLLFNVSIEIEVGL